MSVVVSRETNGIVGAQINALAENSFRITDQPTDRPSSTLRLATRPMLALVVLTLFLSLFSFLLVRF